MRGKLKNTIIEGIFELKPVGKNLQMLILPEYLAAAQEEFDADYFVEHSDNDALGDLFNNMMMSNSSWAWVFSEHIGALTDAPIIGMDVPFDDYGGIKEKKFYVYAYMDYQIRSAAAELLAGKTILWTGAKVKPKKDKK